MPLDLPSSPKRPSGPPVPLQAAISVAVISADPLVASALRARLAAAPQLWLVSDAATAAVIVWDPPAFPAGELPALPLEPPDGVDPPAVVALVGEAVDPMPLLAAGVRGLLRRDADSGRLQAAIIAAKHGLSILDEDPADAVVAQWSPAESSPVLQHDPLTPREREVLEQLASGLSNRAIGEALGISAHTVKFHVDALLDKLVARSRTEVVVKAMREGLLELA
jgi:two-component system nitrate/nitrite response regulator NarL